MRDSLIAAVRTGIQSVVAMIVAWAAGFDVFVDADALTIVLTGVGVSVVTLALRWLETRLPWLTTVLSIGTTKSGPTYN